MPSLGPWARRGLGAALSALATVALACSPRSPGNGSPARFEYDADKEKLEKAKKAARDGSYQAIYDAYQALDAPHVGYVTEFGAYGAGIAGLGYGLSGYDSSSYDFRLDSYD